MNIFIWGERSLKPLQTPIAAKKASKNVISDGSSIFHVPSNQIFPLTTIKNLSSSNSAFIAVTLEGLVFGCCTSENPLCPVPSPSLNLKQIEGLSEILEVSLSQTHAAAVSSSGSLFTWGSGSSGQLGFETFEFVRKPTKVESCQHSKVVQVSCGESFTAILTDGCYVRIYGKIGFAHAVRADLKGHKSLSSFSHSLLNTEKIVMIQTGSSFLSCLNETGEVFILDDCADLVKLPVRSQMVVQKIVASQAKVCGIIQEGFVIWENSHYQLKDQCGLADWTGKVYKSGKFSEIFEWGEDFLISGLKIDFFNTFTIVKAYTRSEMGKALIKNFNRKHSDGFICEKNIFSIHRSKSESIFNDEEFFQDTLALVILKYINRKVKDSMFSAFKAIRDQSFIKHWQETTLNKSRILANISQSFNKQMNSVKFISFHKLKLWTFSRFLEVPSLNLKIKLKSILLQQNIGKKIIKRYFFEITRYEKFYAACKMLKKTYLRISLKKMLEKTRLFEKVLVFQERPEIKNVENSKIPYHRTESSDDRKPQPLYEYIRKRFKLQDLQILNRLPLNQAILNQLFSILNSLKIKSCSGPYHMIKRAYLLRVSLSRFEFNLKNLLIRSLNSYFKSLVEPKTVLRAFKSLITRRLSRYFHELLILCSQDLCLNYYKFFFSLSLVLSTSNLKLKLFALKALKSHSSLNISKVSELTLSRSLSNDTLPSIPETPRKPTIKSSISTSPTRDTRLLKSESLNTKLIFSSQNTKKESFLSLSILKQDKGQSPKPSRPPWRPPSFFINSPVSSSKSEASKRRKQYEEVLRRQTSPKQKSTIKKKLLCIGTPNSKTSSKSSPVNEKSLALSLAVMSLARVVKRTLNKEVKKAFCIIYKNSRAKVTPAPQPNDEKFIIQAIKTSWKTGLVLIASEKTREIMKKIANRDFFSILKSI